MLSPPTLLSCSVVPLLLPQSAGSDPNSTHGALHLHAHLLLPPSGLPSGTSPSLQQAPICSIRPLAVVNLVHSPVSPVLGRRFRWAGGVHWRGRLSLCLSASGGRLWRRGPPPAAHQLPPSTVLLLAASCSAASCDAYPHWFLIRAVWAQRSSLSSTRWPDSARSCRTLSCSMISRGNRCFWHCLSCCPIGFGAG